MKMNLTKKALAVLLSVLMMMTSFVFFASAASTAIGPDVNGNSTVATTSYQGSTFRLNYGTAYTPSYGQISDSMNRTYYLNYTAGQTKSVKISLGQDDTCVCGAILREYLPYNTTISQIQSTDASVVDHATAAFATEDGTGYPCVEVSLSAKSAGTATVTFNVYQNINSPYEEGRCSTCGRAVRCYAVEWTLKQITVEVTVAPCEHVDNDNDAHCDNCGEFLGSTENGGTGATGAVHSKEGLEWRCVDEHNHDGYCKTCGKLIVKHAPHEFTLADGVYTCVKCAYQTATPADGTHVDANGDGVCDDCGCPVGADTDPTVPGGGNNGDDPNNPGGGNNGDDPNNPGGSTVDPDTCKHEDKDGDGVCDKCNTTVGHQDNDGDDNCDFCDKDMDQFCNCICHRQGKIYKIFFKIARVFWKLFGTNPICKCGKPHYTRLFH